NVEERMNQLTYQIESGVNVYTKGPLVEIGTKNPKDGKCYEDRTIGVASLLL
ncbi:hypothetical protein HAX54_040603, partial [Datura stramonium]|nr:hypothetical protein [Datura stramonium]